jgi:hypothetical protein
LDVNALLGLVDLAILPAFFVVVVPVLAMLISAVLMIAFISIFELGAESTRNQISVKLRGSR